MMSANSDVQMIESIGNSLALVKFELKKRVVGQEAVIDDLLCCFLAGGHCLLVGVPGLAKTMLVQTLAQCLHLQFSRIQFTPDLMPSDITGSELLFEDRTTGHREFRFVKGPVFGNVILADEVNRTPPKTQSALLQAMQEGEVTSSGKTFPLPRPFWVLATQNPIEQEGTYPLPEAQQDRFMFSIEMSYPDKETEVEIVRGLGLRSEVSIAPQLNADQIESFRSLVRRVPVANSVLEYAVSLCRSTRPSDPSCPASVKDFLTWGAGPRASQFLVLAAQAFAVIDGRPTPDLSDIRRAAFPVLRHRIVRSFNAETEDVSSNEIIRRLVS